MTTAGQLGRAREDLAPRRAALPSGPSLFANLLREVTESLGAASGVVAVFSDETRTRVRTIASIVDGRLLPRSSTPSPARRASR